MGYYRRLVCIVFCMLVHLELASCQPQATCRSGDCEEMEGISQLQQSAPARSAGRISADDTHFALLERRGVSQPPSLGLRAPKLPPHAQESVAAASGDKDDPRCQGNGVFNCAGPHVPYHSEPGVMYESEFEVPAIPETFKPPNWMTFYDYFNLWYPNVPAGGRFNQFVPQLYLGSVLCNSSNAVEEDGMAYKPKGIFLNTWHLGAMYYFALCDKGSDGKYNCTSTGFNSRAATGKLVPVEPGERVWTRFVLSPNWVWTLSMGVVGGGPDRESYVMVEKPFMGLLDSTSSWTEERYRHVSVGACQENYQMIPGSIPSPWEIDFTVTSMWPRDDWHPWTDMVRARCP